MDEQVTRVVVVDDHRTVAELLSAALDREPDLQVVGVAGDADEAVRVVGDTLPDVVVMDVQLPGADGFEATRRLLAALPETRVVMLTAHTDADVVVRAAAAGACAFLPKDGSLSRLLTAVRRARVGAFEFHPPTPSADGEPVRSVVVGQDGQVIAPLTPREREVPALMGEGLDVRTIAATLRITEHTCRGYVKALMAKLGARTQLQAVVTAWRAGLLRQAAGS